MKPPDTPPRLGGLGAGDRLLFAKSTDDGKTWKGRSVEDSVAVCRFCLTTPEAAIDAKTGNLYVVFEASDTGPPTPRDDRNIFFMASSDKGETFSKRIQLNDDNDPARKPNYNQLFPGLSVAPNGRVDVAWFDFRTDGLYNPEGRGYSNFAGETCWDVYYTFSIDGGESWAKSNLRVSDRSMNKNEGFSSDPYDARGPMGVASTDAVAHIAWGDSRAGNPVAPVQDTYFASVIRAADLRAAQLSQLEVAEDRQDVEAELALVELSGARSQAGPLGQPRGGKVGKGDCPRIGVDPGAPVEIDAHSRQPGVGLALRPERRGAGVFDSLEAVSGLVPARVELANASPRLPPCHPSTMAIRIQCGTDVARNRSEERSRRAETASDLRFRMERATRIELAFSAWEADVLPLNYAREELPAYPADDREAATSSSLRRNTAATFRLYGRQQWTSPC